MNDNARLIKLAEQVYKRYADFYGSDLIQGAEFLIAEEIAKTTGATIKIGELYSNELNNRSHCWCIVNGITLDPIYNHLKTRNSSTQKKELNVEEDMPVPKFESLVERYRQYQI